MDTPTTYLVPEPDREEFFKLPSHHQAEIRALLQIIWTVDHTTEARMAAWDAAIAAANQDMLAQGLKRRFKRQTVYNQRAAFLAADKDWTKLIDARKAPGWDFTQRRWLDTRKRGLPAPFIEFLKGLLQRNGRSSEQAIDEVYRKWKAGEVIPGYGIWTSWFVKSFPNHPMPAAAPFPDGWGRRNLRNYFPPPAQLTTARRGIAAGLMKLPTIIRTRVGLRPMEYVVLDDWRADFLCFVPGVERPVEINGILAMDVASATAIRFGMRPALPRADQSTEGLKRIDTRSLVADMLLKYGYPLDYPCTLVVENGTATITPDDARAISDVTDGRVRVQWTSMISGQVFGFPDKPVGNFRGKAWLESFFNLVHNLCGNIAGQIGSTYEARPRQIPAMDAELKALVRAQAVLPAQTREHLNYRMPFLNVQEAKQALEWVFHWANHRDHHHCEGFDQILKVRLTEHDPYRAVSQLIAAGHQREALLALNPRPMLESPSERWNRLAADVRWGRVPPSAAPQLLANHRLVTVEIEGEINLGSKSNPDIYRDRESPHLKPGRKFLSYTSSTDDRFVHLTEDRRYVCSVPRAAVLRMGDVDGLREEMAAKGRQLKRTLRQIRAVDASADQRLADVEHNLRLAESQVAATQPILPDPSAATTVHAPAADGLETMEATLAFHKARRRRAQERIDESSGDLDAIFGDRAGEEDNQQADAADMLAKLT